MKQKNTRFGQVLSASAIFVAAHVAPASAADAVRVVLGGGTMTWDSSMVHHAQNKGFFKEEGVEVTLIPAQGGGQILQILLAAKADIAAGVGTLATLSAFASGAPIRIIGNEQTGADDLFWYVRKDSPVMSLKDMANRSIAYSGPGSATHQVALDLDKSLRAANAAGMKLVSTGGFADTYTQVMTGQIDAGFSAVPFLFDKVRTDDIRMVIRGSESEEFQGMMVRAYVAHLDFLKQRRDVAKRYMKALARAIDWAYANPKEASQVVTVALKMKPEDAEDLAALIPKSAVMPTPISGLDKANLLAVRHGFLKKPLTAKELEELVDIVQ